MSENQVKSGRIQRFLKGDRAAIDTLETFTQVQNRKIQTSEAELELIKSRIALVAFMADTAATDLLLLRETIQPESNCFPS